MKLSGIYKISSIIKDFRIYIGSAINIKQRNYLHLSQLRNNKHHSKKLQRHFNKYGEKDLLFEIIEECTVETLINREQYWIDLLNPYFNTAKIAGSTLGVKCSEESNIKRKETWSKKTWTDEDRKKFDFSDRRTLTEEGRKRISEHNKNKIISDETKKKISIAKTGKSNLKLKGRIFTEEWRKKISEAKRGKGKGKGSGKPLSEEHKQRIREGKARRKDQNNGSIVMIRVA